MCFVVHVTIQVIVGRRGGEAVPRVASGRAPAGGGLAARRRLEGVRGRGGAQVDKYVFAIAECLKKDCRRLRDSMS